MAESGGGKALSKGLKRHNADVKAGRKSQSGGRGSGKKSAPDVSNSPF
jgi:hypothetical protein